MFDFIKRKTNAPNRDLYMGLILKEQEGEVILLEANSETRIIHPLDQKKFTYTDSWEHLDADVDQTLFEVEKRSGVEIEKTVLFVFSHFVDQEKKSIKNPYKSKIKSLGDELGLDIIGFVEFHEALGIYFHTVEQTPLSAIVIELDGPHVTIFVYKAGKVQYAQTLAQTTDIIGDLERVFTTLKGTYLPARMILYDSNDQQEISDKIMSHSWDENLFIQMPKIEVISPEKLQTALYSCFAKQVFEEGTPIGASTGAIVGGVVGAAEDAQEEVTAPVEETAPAEEVKETSEVNSDEGQEEEEAEEKKEDYSEDDVQQEQVATVSPPIAVPTAVEGFTIGKDIAEEGLVDEPMESEVLVSIPSKRQLSLPSFTMPTLPTFSFPQFKMSFLNSKGTMIAGIALLLLLIVGGLASAIYYHTAQITLLYRTPKISENIVMSDIRTKDQSTTVPVSQTVNATGKKTVGEEAKGQIQLFNVEKAERNLKKGAELKTDAGVIFVLSADVKIASASSSTTSGGDVTITTGKQKAAVTAKEIGPNGNISKDTKLVFDGISADSLKAVADSAFTGGSKRDITTVSREDIDKLKKQAEKEAKDKAKNSASIEQLAVITLSKADYSHEVGEESSDVSLKAQAKVTIPQTDETAIKSEIARKLSSKVESGYRLTPESVVYTVTKAEEEKGDVTVTLSVKATPQYKLDKTQFLRDIKGKSAPVAGEIAKNDYLATDFNITINSFLPFLKNRIPFFDKNIQTDIRSM